ncbi:MAG TPA: cation diffusion facilitator family transporter [Gaiellaceae bacterium]|nr:cation diffusion facilitator family transporter [Gaiellaceae bacterium]HEX2506354.1 cation diffusion facilitator family transporter [Gaiellaceae bacterium]
MTPQRRTALVSVLAATFLIALKLSAGLASGSLGLLSEAIHSGTDLVAALLTFFAVGVAGRPADPGHPYGHGRVEHLAALAEATILVLASLFISYRALQHLVGSAEPEVEATWYAFLVIGIVIAVDASRAYLSRRASRRYGSAALEASALHFASDLAGSVAVLIGLALVAAGYPRADSLAALFVAVLVLFAAARLIRTNADVLMDRTPDAADRAAREAIAAVRPAVELRRLRLRQSAGKHFADVVIGVSPGAVVGQAHAAADAVEDAVHEALPDSDVVVHVEPRREQEALRERVLAAALGVPRVREVHNLRVVAVDGGLEVGLHLKLPGDLPLEEAHAVASEVEGAIEEAVPGVVSVQTHLEPLREAGRGARLAEADERAVAAVVRERTGQPPREVRFIATDDGVLLFVTIGVEGGSLAQAHQLASEIEERIRAEVDVADVVVHTEP